MRSLWLLLLVLSGCAGAPPLQRFEFTRLQMGVQSSIVTWAPDRETAVSAAAAAFDRIAVLDAMLSDYREQSELSRLGAAAGGPARRVSPELYSLLETAADLHARTGEAFDITIGPLVRLWREARQSGVLPEPERMEEARARVGADAIVLDPETKSVRIMRPGVRLDLGGIAKGYAAQEALAVLRDLGLARSLVALSGDIAAGDPPPGAEGWRIAVETGPVRRVGVLVVSNACVSTSGDTEQYVEIDGVRYAHIVDPRTGLGLTNRRAAAAVSARGEWADALATAACILGPEAMAAVLPHYPGTALVIEEADGNGRRRTILDPSGVLRWDGLPAEVAPSEGSR